MKIVITADLHYDVARSRKGVRRLARDAVATGGDVLVLLGDTAGVGLEPLRECLGLFADFPGRTLLVPGNHCLWCREGEDSIERYERVLPEVAAEFGAAVLDHNPVVIGDTGLVGSVGWYDYSFRDESLEIPLSFYRAKVAPGAARRIDRHRHLVETHADELGQRQLAMPTRWMDGEFIRLGVSDEEFSDRLVAKLRRQIEDLSPGVARIVAFMHHLPFRELVPRDRPDRFAFAAAYMGTQKLGDVLLACDKVSHVYCGHSHWPGRHRIGHVNVINVGSTYVEKKLESLELP